MHEARHDHVGEGGDGHEAHVDLAGRDDQRQAEEHQRSDRRRHQHPVDVAGRNEGWSQDGEDEKDQQHQDEEAVTHQQLPTLARARMGYRMGDVRHASFSLRGLNARASIVETRGSKMAIAMIRTVLTMASE